MTVYQYRCPDTGHRAILKWDGSTASPCGYPARVLCFWKDPATRATMGRWFETPSASLKLWLWRQSH